MKVPGTTSNKRQELGARSREAILDAASRLMAARGYDGASISRIAEESGLPAASIYWHFGSKAGVLEAVMERGARRFFDRIEDLEVPEEGTARDILRAQLGQAAAAIRADPDFLRLFILLLLSHGVDATVREVRAEGRRRMHDQLELAFACHGTDAAAAVAEQLADVGVAMFDGAFLAVQNNPQLDYEPLLLEMADALALLGSTLADATERA